MYTSEKRLLKFLPSGPNSSSLTFGFSLKLIDPALGILALLILSIDFPLQLLKNTPTE